MTEPAQTTSIMQVVSAVKGSMLFIGLILGILLYILVYYQTSKHTNFFKFLFSKNCIVSVLINLIVGTGLIISWQIDPTSLEILKIHEVTFITSMEFGIAGVLIIHNVLNALKQK